MTAFQTHQVTGAVLNTHVPDHGLYDEGTMMIPTVQMRETESLSHHVTFPESYNM